MQTNDPRVKTQLVDGQVLYFPTQETWEELKKSSEFGGSKIPVPDLVFPKVERNSRYKDLHSAFGFAFGQLMFYELLELDGISIRVYVESVICEHCGKRAEISATPGVSEIYYGCEDKRVAMDRGYSYPNLPCPYCRKSLQRRYTIWRVK
ncbi:MAG TPA: hypothetical protein V6D50_19915 [Chroococcales cyanobacterium]|jgi:hypothetical protein